MADSKLLRGTMVLTAATLISKILGFIYIIPFNHIVGSDGIGLYQFGYIPYTVMLSLATAGVPLAVSKFVSKYQALDDYETGYRLFRSGLILMSITGFIAFLLLFLLAPIMAPYISPEAAAGIDKFTLDDIIFAIRMVSFALIVVPLMAIIRGYFQGFQSMGPTSVSQVLEQIVRICFILAAAFLVMNVGNGNLVLAVGFATFGAFVGAIGGLVVLIYYWFKRRKAIIEKVESTKVRHEMKLKDMYKELISYALPLSFVGLAIPLFQFIDLFTVKAGLSAIGFEEANSFFGIFTGTVHKVVLIPMALATALSITLVPTITKSFTNNDQITLQKQITQTYQIILFISFPAAVGMATLGESIYISLYGYDNEVLGGAILSSYGPITLLFSLFAVTGAILQGMNRQKFAVIALIIGLLFKLATNYLFIILFGEYGAIISSYLGFLVAIGINVWAIGHYANFHYGFILKRLLLISIFSGVMAVGVWIVNEGMQLFFPLTSRFNSFLVMLVGVAVGVILYFFLAVRSRLAGQILGDRFDLLNYKKQRHRE
ncbi:cell division protein [Alkalihalobacillus alcalophilus ATCC 27647 = CGMCC 1.3604]|uniref:Cell division protein n=1 Tax=Alkalihalobacillus alcalophilus ATCC 27647 = CGMCC 1.3604 TaxID=1218173 RepID=J8TVI1_ALKAL|nr:polysaccharide biosynthesis protein [Alkalihalobacillus alcalophilus]AFV25670.1 polysaccharide export transporter [Alkalihalobacillus alcalophilus ATCC 27647 = CGMCC 1.3604]KGA98769.1 cell division protein [Alkalihalobacillus alcalophilus ATCC 27647 = CGMCC 1.3604]MED1560949.1 polysaccharide biosynthesis protein [Alkalihalobacillus alcalophilus]THG92163.1 cell division protein [Alkalihalobacillus alcalophilus ATCC 27647 = CGMCC 1.3604]